LIFFFISGAFTSVTAGKYIVCLDARETGGSRILHWSEHKMQVEGHKTRA